jgi:hypothetical protein
LTVRTWWTDVTTSQGHGAGFVDAVVADAGIGVGGAAVAVIMLIDDLHVRVVNATTGELLRELIIDPSRDYQPRN